MTTYTGLILSLVLLLLAFIAFCLLRGAQTNSNTIHKNLTACIFIVQLLFLAALKIRHILVQQEVGWDVVVLRRKSFMSRFVFFASVNKQF